MDVSSQGNKLFPLVLILPDTDRALPLARVLMEAGDPLQQGVVCCHCRLGIIKGISHLPEMDTDGAIVGRIQGPIRVGGMRAAVVVGAP